MAVRIAPGRPWRKQNVSNMQGHAEVSTLVYHYDGSGRFFLRLGDECAGAMLKLMGRK